MQRDASRHGPLGVTLRGFVMGSADLVPGVSGGTMALILGIYRRLIDALGALTRGDTWRAVRRGDLGTAWRAVDATFLLALALGIGVAIVTLAAPLGWLLANRRSSIYALFFGLIAASAVLVVGRAHRRGASTWAWAAAGAVAAFVLVGATPATTPENAWFLLLAGAVAVSALLLPGLSGAFILVLLGKYEYVLAALSARDLAVLVPFALGLGLGLLAFSRALAVLLRRHHDPTMGLLAGVLLGSLRKVWPWQMDAGTVSVNQLPPAASEVVWALLLALAGALAVWGIQRLGTLSERRDAA